MKTFIDVAIPLGGMSYADMMTQIPKVEQESFGALCSSMGIDQKRVRFRSNEQDGHKTCPRCASPCHKHLTDDSGHWEWRCGTCIWQEFSN